MVADRVTPLLTWNRGGWFGSQIGGTAWMIALGGYLMARGETKAAGLSLGMALVANLLGTWLWKTRERRKPYPALQILLAVSGLAGLVVVLGIDRLGTEVLPPGGLRPTILLVYPMLMLAFHVQLRGARR